MDKKTALVKDKETENQELLPGGPERSGGPPGSGAATVIVNNPNRARIPDPQVFERPKPRHLTVEYKLQILKEADACAEAGEIGALLRREGLYSSHLSNWRKLRERALLGRDSRGRKPDPQARRIAELECEIQKYKLQLKQAELIISAQKKIAEIFKSPMQDLPSEGGK